MRRCPSSPIRSASTPPSSCSTAWSSAASATTPASDGQGGLWTYAELLDRANRIANVLVEDLGLVPGNRVLLRAANNPMHAAAWFAVMKAGGIAVGTMPLLRARELSYVIEKAAGQIRDLRQRACRPSLRLPARRRRRLRRSLYFNSSDCTGLESRMAAQTPRLRQCRDLA